MMLGEMASAAGGHRKAAWIREMFKRLPPLPADPRPDLVRPVRPRHPVADGDLPQVTEAFRRGIRRRRLPPQPVLGPGRRTRPAAELIRARAGFRSRGIEDGSVLEESRMDDEPSPHPPGALPPGPPRRRPGAGGDAAGLVLPAAAAAKNPRPLYWGAVIGRQLTGKLLPGTSAPWKRSSARPARAPRCSPSRPPSPTATRPVTPSRSPSRRWNSPRTRDDPLPQLGLAIGPGQPQPARLQPHAAIANGSQDAFIREYAER